MSIHQPEYIVAIGASAGGLLAIQQFFDNLDNCSDLAFIIIQHLSPNHKSLLVELIAKHTGLKVSEAKDNARVLPGHVYVIPPRMIMGISDGLLTLKEKAADNKPNHTIDIFFESLARDAGKCAVGIVLSGTGTDGTEGIMAIRAAGGLTIVQEPETAQFDGMPLSAAGSGYADAVLPPDEIPYELLQRISPRDYPNFQEERPDDSSMENLFAAIRDRTGCDFTYYKPPTILRRLARRMSSLKMTSFGDYLQYLYQEEDEAKLICKDFLINVTRFFRDEEAYDILYRKVFPQMLEHHPRSTPIKIWVTACSTGEEAYTIAILLDRYLQEHHLSAEVKIFATDIDQSVIDVAAKGLYPASIAHYIPAHILNDYFIKRDGVYTISPHIRKQIVFAKHDITGDPPFIKNNLVSCRNMLIYMNAALQRKVISTLQYATSSGGFLMLGPTESADTAKDTLEEFDRRWKIYRKKADHEGNTFSLIDYYSVNAGNSKKGQVIHSANSGAKAANELQEVLTGELGYAALYIGSNYDIREATGAYEKFLTLPGKKLHLNLLKMVSPDLASLITNALHKARNGGGKVLLPPAIIRDGERARLVSVFVRSAENGRHGDSSLVVLGELPHYQAGPDIAPMPRPEGADTSTHIVALEEELGRLRQNLQSAVEGLETANEELQSTNEELLSSNEELQSSNEELQSLNEELHTLNTEHQVKIQELILLNDDLNNYFRSTDIGQVFVDGKLRVRKFNPPATRLINLIEGDIGRPITDIAHQLTHGRFHKDLQQVLNTGQAVEHEVIAADGRTSIMRVMPYLRIDGTRDGLIISFVDITAQKELDNIIKSVFDASISAVLALKAVRKDGIITDFGLIAANKSAQALMEVTGDGDAFRAFMDGQVAEGLFLRYIEVVETGAQLHLEHQFKSGGLSGWFEIVAARMDDGLVITLTDISSRKTADEQLRAQYSDLMVAREHLKALTAELEEKVAARTEALSASEERFRLITQATNDALWDWNIINNSFWWSSSFYSQFGYSDAQIAGSYSFWLSQLHPEERVSVRKSLDKAINSGGSQWSTEHSFLKADGSYARVLNRAYILHDEYGTPYRVLGSMLDISTLRAAQELAAETKAYNHVLQQMNKELEQSNFALQQFASVASHDLKEPLRKIEVFSGLLKNRIGGDPTGSDYLGRINQAASRMNILIHDLLNFSSLSKKVAFTSTDLNTVLSEVLSDLEISITEKGVMIEQDHLPVIDGVQGQMRQVFQNMISNAIKFSRPTERPRISIRCRRMRDLGFGSPEAKNGPYVEIMITDNGIGFEMEYVSRIFIIFQRLHNKDAYQGSGIGLAIVKKIVENHKGMITAESKPGAGSTFRIILPVRQAQAEAHSLPTQAVVA